MVSELILIEEPGTVVVGPDGREWRIGEQVGFWPAEQPKPEPVTIRGYWDGDWAEMAPDPYSAWFVLDDGYWVRPYLLCKLS